MGWFTINLGVVFAFGLSNGHFCDASMIFCDPYVKLFIDGKLIHETSPKNDKITYNSDYQYVSEKIKKSSEIKIQVWDEDGETDELILESIGDVNSFLNEPFRGGDSFEIDYNHNKITQQNSINTYSFWEDEYEN